MVISVAPWFVHSATYCGRTLINQIRGWISFLPPLTGKAVEFSLFALSFLMLSVSVILFTCKQRGGLMSFSPFLCWFLSLSLLHPSVLPHTCSSAAAFPLAHAHLSPLSACLSLFLTPSCPHTQLSHLSLSFPAPSLPLHLIFCAHASTLLLPWLTDTWDVLRQFYFHKLQVLILRLTLFG